MKQRFTSVRNDDNEFLIFENQKPLCCKIFSKTKDIVDFLNAVVQPDTQIQCQCKFEN